MMTREQLSKLSKDELIERILAAQQKQSQHSNKQQSLKKSRRAQAFDMDKYCQRRVAFKIAYLGWSYDGLAVQDSTNNTIEYHLFQALHKSRLITDRTLSNFNRCGRTDKGVSALCQVVALNVRSNLPIDHPDAILPMSGADKVISKVPLDQWLNHQHELNYAKMLNGLLPKDIRVLGWAPVHKEFSARFDCKFRQYKYFFPRGDLDLDKMQQAAQLLVGGHDFRNLCKVDPNKGFQSFIRRVLEVSVGPADDSVSPDSMDKRDMCVFMVKGTAFLWHQVRCMMQVLFMVGQGIEQPDIIRRILDVEATPEKPLYKMASEVPLVLWDCAYDPPLEFVADGAEQTRIYTDTFGIWSDLKAKTAIIDELLGPVLETCLVRPNPESGELAKWSECQEQLLESFRQAENAKHIPLMDNISQNEMSLQERLVRGEARLQARLKRKNDSITEADNGR